MRGEAVNGMRRVSVSGAPGSSFIANISVPVPRGRGSAGHAVVGPSDQRPGPGRLVGGAAGRFRAAGGVEGIGSGVGEGPAGALEVFEAREYGGAKEAPPIGRSLR